MDLKAWENFAGDFLKNSFGKSRMSKKLIHSW